MVTTTERIAAYGLVNGLGLAGEPKERAKLIQSVGRAIERGDMARVFRLAASYGVGVYAGSIIRKVVSENVQR